MNRVTSRPYPNLLTWREAHGYSQHEAAKRLGITQAMYSRFERGAQACSGKQAKEIMAVTGVPLEVLVGAA